jgi:hypothetical protein
LAGGCAAASAPAPDSVLLETETLAPQEQAWLQREIVLPPLQHFESDDGVIAFDAPATLAAEIERNDEYEYYRLPLEIGTRVPALCFLYDSYIDMARSVTRTAEVSFSDIETTLFPVTSKQLLSVDAGHAGGAPLIEASWLFTATHEDDSLVGQVKLFVAARDGHTLVCHHVIDIGYSQAFATLARTVLQSFRVAGDIVSRPIFEQISTVSIDPNNLGVQHVRVFDNGDGTLQEELVQSMVVPLPTGDLVDLETVQVNHVKANGTLLRRQVVTVERDQLITNLTLRPTEPGLWNAVGIFKTKHYEVEIAADSIASVTGSSRAIAKLIARGGAGSSYRYVDWDGNEPSRAVDAKVDLVTDRGDGTFDIALSVGTNSTKGVVDRDGRLIRTEIPSDRGLLVLNRVYRDGTP